MKKSLLAALICAVTLSGCASGLSKVQKEEFKFYQDQDLAIVKKNTTTAAALGILPGGGSFYTEQYGLGVLNLIAWPFSIFWDPANGIKGAESINYAATKKHVNEQMKNEVLRLDHKLGSKKITADQYIIEKRRVEERYEIF